MNDQDLIKQILEYIKDNRYNQAILIDGEWGSGKTFFVKEKLLEKLQMELQNQKVYYVSLYGVSSTKEVIDSIYSVIFTDIVIKKLGENKGQLLQKGIFLTSKLFKAGIKYFNIEVEDLPKVSDIQELKNIVLIFDDLERCEMEINQILGIINEFVEHNEIRIILVANEKEIGKMNFSKELSNKYQVVLNEKIFFDDESMSTKGKNNKYTRNLLDKRVEQLFAEDVYYKRIKEKLIGLTIYYQSNLSEIFPDIVDKYIIDKNVKTFLLNKKQIIVNLFEKERCYNIRTLIFALIAFDKFYSVIDKIECGHDIYFEKEIKRVLNYTIFSSIHIKLASCIIQSVESK